MKKYYLQNGETVDRKCEERCTCNRGDWICEPRCSGLLFKRGLPFKDPNCFEVPYEDDDCCVKKECTETIVQTLPSTSINGKKNSISLAFRKMLVKSLIKMLSFYFFRR